MSSIKEPTEEKVREWKQSMELAEYAREMFKRNREQSENDFAYLLNEYPDDGMIYFQRAIAYAKYGKYTEAKQDYEKAKELFPLDRWKWEVQSAMEELEQNFSENGAIAESCRRINELKNIDAKSKSDALETIKKVIKEPISSARDLRACEEMLVRKMVNENPNHKFASECAGDDVSLKCNIDKLREINAIPEIILHHMHTIRIIGNYASHPIPKNELKFDYTNVYSSMTAFVAILEWLDRK